MMTPAENYRRSVLFERPERIPMYFAINPSCYQFYDQTALFDLQESHPVLFPGFVRPAARPFVPELGLNARRNAPYRDPWGCVWETDTDGIVGVVRTHPLADWAGLEAFRMPDPAVTDGTFPRDREALRVHVADRRARGELVSLGLPHGHTFLRLQDIRGYEDTICDLFEGEPRLLKVLEMIGEFNCRLVEDYLALKPDIMGFAEDLGMQHGPMISPELFRRYIKPIYRRMMKMSRDAGCMIHMHSDGDLHDLIDDLLDSGVEIVNLQDLVNGVEWIAGRLAGKACIELDIDRQEITRFGTPRQIDELVRREVRLLGSKAGGLMMIFGLYPGMPLDNIRALMDAMERYSAYYQD